MTKTTAPTDVRLRYAPVSEARAMTGLRIVLGAYAVPGPWREACKGIFHVKRLPYVPVATAEGGASDLAFGKDGADRELREWTGQSSAPVVVWNDERPRSHWVDQLYLAERLAPEPPLLPRKVDERMTMMGLAHEICGEGGFGWTKRLLIIGESLATPGLDSAAREFFSFVGAKYHFTPELAAAAPARLAEILGVLAAQLERQRERGSRFLVGDRLTAVDVYWAAFAGIVAPLPEELCPMASDFRGLYTERNPTVLAALAPALLEHRDFVYREYLELPVVF